MKDQTVTTKAAAQPAKPQQPAVKQKWQTPKLEDVSEQVMAQPYIRFTRYSRTSGNAGALRIRVRSAPFLCLAAHQPMQRPLPCVLRGIRPRQGLA